MLIKLLGIRSSAIIEAVDPPVSSCFVSLSGSPYDQNPNGGAADISGQTISKTVGTSTPYTNWYAGTPFVSPRAKTSGLLVAAEYQNVVAVAPTATGGSVEGENSLGVIDPVTNNGITIGKFGVADGEAQTGVINILTAGVPNTPQRIIFPVTASTTYAVGVDQDTGDIKAWVNGVAITDGFLGSRGDGEGHLSAASNYIALGILTSETNKAITLSGDIVTDQANWNYSYATGEDWCGNALPAPAN